ncbi:uncharacterized protein LOC142327138 [Lycorma delicatula]|uniref:uncharacterized protein LOC142327138 n=1 Tax=Lycorma delicatula TaxID=130591 RepID=UPI003F512AA2
MVSNRFTILIVFYMVYNCQVNGEELKRIRQMYLNENQVVIELGKLLEKEFSNNCLGCISSFYSYESKRVQNIIEYMTTNNLNSETLPKENDIYISVKEIENNYEKYSNEVSWWNYLCELYKLQVSPPPKINYEEVVEKIGVDKLITKGNTEGLYKCINTFVTIINGKLLEKINNIYNENISTVEKHIQLSDTDQTRVNCLAGIKTYISHENKRVENLLESIKKNETLETLLEGQNLILSKEIKLNFEKYRVGFLQWLNTCTRYKYSEESQLTKNIQQVVKKIGEGNLIKEGKTKGLNKCIDSYAKQSTLINYVKERNFPKIQMIMNWYHENYLLFIDTVTPFYQRKASCVRCLEEYIKQELENIMNFTDPNNTTESTNSVFEIILSKFEIFKKKYQKLFQMCNTAKREESDDQIPNFDDIIKNIGVENLISGDSSEGLEKCIDNFMVPINNEELKTIEHFYKNNISENGSVATDSRSGQSKNYCYGCIASFIIYEQKKIEIYFKILPGKVKIENVHPKDIKKYLFAKEIVNNYEIFKKNYDNWKVMCDKYDPKNSNKKQDAECILNGIEMRNLIDNGKIKGIDKCISAFVNPENIKDEDKSSHITV